MLANISKFLFQFLNSRTWKIRIPNTAIKIPNGCFLACTRKEKKGPRNHFYCTFISPSMAMCLHTAQHKPSRTWAFSSRWANTCCHICNDNKLLYSGPPSYCTETVQHMGSTPSCAHGTGRVNQVNCHQTYHFKVHPAPERDNSTSTCWDE